MRTWFRTRRQVLGMRQRGRRLSYHPVLDALENRCLPSGGPAFVETNLVSDIPGLAAHTDPAVVNPWGFTENSRGEFLLSDNGTGTAALVAPDGTPLGAPIVIPPPGGSPAGTTSAPTGQVTNSSADFVISEGGRSAPATVLFATEDGTIAGFNSAVDPFQAILGADQSASGAVYKGLAMGSAGGANFLYATNFHAGTVDVFDKSFAKHTFFVGQFTDPNAPTGFAPFGVKNIGGILFVTFAKQNDAKHDDVAGPGNGFIDEFDTSGHFLMRLASGTAAGGTLTALNSPWGMAIAPAGFGTFGHALLVGNFGDSHVSAFDPLTGRFLGQLEDANGQPLVLVGGFQGSSTKGLWGIGFGNGQGGDANPALFFASGINDEMNGLFGMVNVVGGEDQDDNSQGDDQGGNNQGDDQDSNSQGEDQTDMGQGNEHGSGFVQTALVSSIPGLAPHTDPALLNPWGFTVSSRGEFQISDNNGGNAALFAPDGMALGAPIVMPPPAGSPAGSTGTPTGQVLNATSDFVISEGGSSAPAAALFSTEDGTIIGFNSSVDPSNGILAADQSAAGAVYKGLAMGSAGGANYLYAANFHNGTVDVFDTSFALHTFSANQFTDPGAPAGFAPFGIADIHGILFVTYAKQNAEKHDDVEGPGNGFIDEFSTSGVFLKRFASGSSVGGTLTALNSPWGMALAPQDFGKFGGALLVGNFGDSHVNAFDPLTGRFLGQLEDTNSQPLVLDGGFKGSNTKGLWQIGFGNGQDGASTRTLFFTSGINDEMDGVFGKVTLHDRFAVGEFPGHGVWRHSDSVGWEQLSPADADHVSVDDDGNVAAAFANGLWRFDDASGWQFLTPAIASQIDIAGNGIVIAEFPGNGLWRNGDPTFVKGGWQQLTPADALSIGVDDQGDTIASFKGNGVFLYQDAGGWNKLTSAVADQVSIAASGSSLAAMFQGNGLWRYTMQGSATTQVGWQQMTSAIPMSMDIGPGGAVVCAFGNGVWLNQESGGWVQLMTVPATQVGATNSGAMLAELPGKGVWEYADNNWQQLTPADAEWLR
jgi:uncharacterized protein (TIGR03118 family)